MDDGAFARLGLSDPIVQGVRALGFSEPTPIQRRAIPLILTGRDLVSSAQTGAGKTAAFVLPILMRLAGHGSGLRALVLVPTRELAAQVEAEARACAQFTSVRAGSPFGGVPNGSQERKLRHTSVDLLIATPSRLLELHQRQGVTFDDVRIVVLDAADRMFDMGFAPELRRILRLLPRARQTLMFSATMPAQLDPVAGEAMTSPTRLEIAGSAQMRDGSTPRGAPAPRGAAAGGRLVPGRDRGAAARSSRAATAARTKPAVAAIRDGARTRPAAPNRRGRDRA